MGSKGITQWHDDYTNPDVEPYWEGDNGNAREESSLDSE